MSDILAAAALVVIVLGIAWALRSVGESDHDHIVRREPPWKFEPLIPPLSRDGLVWIGVEDLEKARWYIDREIARRTGGGR